MTAPTFISVKIVLKWRPLAFMAIVKASHVPNQMNHVVDSAICDLEPIAPYVNWKLVRNYAAFEIWSHVLNFLARPQTYIDNVIIEEYTAY